MRLRAFSRAWRSLVMVPKRRSSPLRPGSAMAMTMESLWTSRPRYSVIAFMVWLSVRIQLMNQNVYPAQSEDVLDRNHQHHALFNHNMSKTSKLLLAVIASSTLLFGCSTPRHAERWEYKTVTLNN